MERGAWNGKRSGTNSVIIRRLETVMESSNGKIAGIIKREKEGENDWLLSLPRRLRGSAEEYLSFVSSIECIPEKNGSIKLPQFSLKNMEIYETRHAAQHAAADIKHSDPILYRVESARWSTTIVSMVEAIHSVHRNGVMVDANQAVSKIISQKVLHLGNYSSELKHDLRDQITRDAVIGMRCIISSDLSFYGQEDILEYLLNFRAISDMQLGNFDRVNKIHLAYKALANQAVG